MKKIYVVLFSVFLYLFPVPYSLFPENNFSFRIAPSIESPIGIEQLSLGMGAKLSLDWSFFTFARNFDAGVTAGGAFTSLSVQTGDPLTLFEGMGGAFLRYRPFDRWAFRFSANAGAYQYSRDGASAANPLFSFTLGAEFHLSPYFSLFADGQYTYRAFSSVPLPTIGAAAGLCLNLSEIMTGRARVQMEKTQQYRVFPVSWAWYEHNPIATITITNNEPNSITNINLSFFIESYMSEPWTFASLPRLDPGESIEVPVTALFNESLINLTENVTANGVVQIQYRSLGARKESTSSMQIPIYHRNTFSWEDDRRAAAFVSPRDFSAMLFARNAAAAVEGLQVGNTPRNVLYAAAVFEALRLYRINYVNVPSSSYQAISGNEAVLDNVSYPYQALYYRGGDCSYLSILLCSMLEALDIESAFITVPGHIFIAFAVDDNTWQANNRDIINIDGKRWIPIETTVTSRGFTQGWQIGLRQWRNAGDKAALYQIRECWELYPSVTVPASGDNPPAMPDLSSLRNAVEREVSR